MDAKVYNPSEVAKMLGLGRTRVYEYLEEVFKVQDPFVVIKVGKLYKIPKGPFDKWISGEYA